MSIQFDAELKSQSKFQRKNKQNFCYFFPMFIPKFAVTNDVWTFFDSNSHTQALALLFLCLRIGLMCFYGYETCTALHALTPTNLRETFRTEFQSIIASLDSDEPKWKALKRSVHCFGVPLLCMYSVYSNLCVLWNIANVRSLVWISAFVISENSTKYFVYRKCIQRQAKILLLMS